MTDGRRTDEARGADRWDDESASESGANDDPSAETADDRTPIDGVLVSDDRDASGPYPDDPFPFGESATDGSDDHASDFDAASDAGFAADGPAANGDDRSTAEDAPSTANDDTVSTHSSTGGATETTGDSSGDVESALPAAVAPSTDDDEVEPVELLVQLARDGEIEPWDIDIVEVTDSFLSRLDATDLRTTGRALFYASVLLRMKSDELLASDDPEEPEPEPWEAAMEGGGDPDFDPVNALEAEMERRLERKHARGSPETLDELVRELREAERGSWWKRSRTYDTSASPHGYDRGTQTLDYHATDDLRREGEPGEGDVTGTTHNEQIEDVIDDVHAVLREQYDNGRHEVLFREFADAGGSTVMTYLALLFLAHRSEVRLQQDDLFGDLWVQDPAAATVEGEVAGVAD